MSPRPRQRSDAEVLANTAAVLSRSGVRSTLAEVAAATGIAPATLIQRFGSKRGLFLRVAEQPDETRSCFAAARAVHASPVDALLFALGECAVAMAPDPLTLARHIELLHAGLADEEFRQVAAARQRQFEDEVRDLVNEAVSWGELRLPDPSAAAKVIVAAYFGGLWNWGLAGSGRVDEAVRGAVEVVLLPYRSG